MTQTRAARLAGSLWILTMASSMVATLYGFSSHVAPGDVIKTASNIMEHESSFRAGIAGMLFTALGVIVLTWALYVLLRPVNRDLALLAAFFRLSEATILCLMSIQQLSTLKFLSPAGYITVFEPGQRYALANISMSTYGSGMYVGFVCLGLGSLLFAYLFLMSGYVPRVFGWLGLFASGLIFLGSFLLILLPGMRNILYPYGMIPMFFFEVGLGIWLWIKGVKLPEPKFAA